MIRDKIAGGDWSAHLGDGRSMFVNAATWGLVVTGKLTASADDRGLSTALTCMVARLGEPVIRRGVDLAMRMMGEQFVTGQTINEALKRSREREERGFGFSYDMLGEAATTPPTRSVTTPIMNRRSTRSARPRGSAAPVPAPASLSNCRRSTRVIPVHRPSA